MEWMTQIPSQFSPLERIYSLLICGEEKGLRDAIKDQISWRSILHLAEKKVTSFVFGPERQTKFSFWLFVFSGRKTTFSSSLFIFGSLFSRIYRLNSPSARKFTANFFLFHSSRPAHAFRLKPGFQTKVWLLINNEHLNVDNVLRYILPHLHPCKRKGGKSLRNIDQKTRVPRCLNHAKSSQEWDRNSQQKVPLLGWSKQIIISKVSCSAIRPSMWNISHRHDTHSDIIGPRLLAIKVGLCSVVV